MARLSVASLTAVGTALALLIFLDKCNDNASEAGLQLSRRARSSRRGERKLTAPLIPRTLSRPQETRRRYRIDGSEIDNEGRRLTDGIVLGENVVEEVLHQDIGSDVNTTDLNVPKFPSRTPNRRKVVVKSVQELRSAVLDNGIPLRYIELKINPADHKIQESGKQNCDNILLDHEVLKIISKRAKSHSKPGKRASDDTANLALSIEGGGMRGAVSAGMVAAIACLGLSDSFDSIYGSSAGSIVGAYMISRQMCIDVYTDVLTAAKENFLCRSRLISSLVRTLVDTVIGRASRGGVKPKSSHHNRPGLNISFVLDGIMCPDFGLRPLDLESFRANDARQPLRVVSSVVRDGKMDVVCFGSKDRDFFDDVSSNGTVTKFATTSIDGMNHGLFACLEASMKVPAATGPPVSLVRNCDIAANITSIAFDAFCYEPIPYRSAVEEGATHVLALRTRPDGFRLRTKPTVYESLMAPHYFQSHGLPQVADFFERGGQQYIYLEDILTLDEGRDAVDKGNELPGSRDNCGGVKVPPPGILYGANPGNISEKYSRDRDTWKKAHLLPVTPVRGTRELSTLSQDKDDVLQAIRDGFAVAFDMLAPSAGLDLSKYPHLNGERVAELVFPRMLNSQSSEEPSGVKGDFIDDASIAAQLQPIARKRKLLRGGIKLRFSRRPKQSSDAGVENSRPSNAGTAEQYLVAYKASGDNELFSGATSQRVACPKTDAKTLLMSLPGIQQGKLSELADGLHYHL